MAGAYDDRDGKIWMDGKLVEWRDAKVHILTHALHYASAVFEGERCYDGKIFKGHEHSLRLIRSAELLDMLHFLEPRDAVQPIGYFTGHDDSPLCGNIASEYSRSSI